MFNGVLRSALWTLSNFLFPAPEEVRRLEQATPAELRQLLTPAEPLPGGPGDLFPAFSYHHRLGRLLIREIKYRGNPFLLRSAGGLLAENIQAELADRLIFEPLNLPAAITSVPMPRRRRRQRGWNQSELLARTAARELGAEWGRYQPLLKRTCEPQPQTELSRAERLENTRDTFQVVKPTAVADQTVIIVDDVATTGATLAEIKRTLKHSGARRVLAFTLGH